MGKGRFKNLINNVAQKLSNSGGKLGFVARAVDNLITTDAEKTAQTGGSDFQSNYKNATTNGDSNEGSNTTNSGSSGSGSSSPSLMKSMWMALPTWGKITAIVVPGGLIIGLVWALIAKGKHKNKNY